MNNVRQTAYGITSDQRSLRFEPHEEHHEDRHRRDEPDRRHRRHEADAASRRRCRRADDLAHRQMRGVGVQIHMDAVADLARLSASPRRRARSCGTPR